MVLIIGTHQQRAKLVLSHLQFLFKAPFLVLQIQPVTSASSLTKTYLVKIIFLPSAKHLTTIFVKYDKFDPHSTSVLRPSLQTLWFLQNLITVIHCTVVFPLYLLTGFKKCKISWPVLSILLFGVTTILLPRLKNFIGFLFISVFISKLPL